jgi:hypothetical protein
MNTEIRRAVFIALMGSEVLPLAVDLMLGLHRCIGTNITASTEKGTKKRDTKGSCSLLRE